MRYTLLAASLQLAACGGQGGPESPTPRESVIRNDRGQDIGRVLLRQKGERMELNVRVTGLTPGLHGMHLHAAGACDGPAFTTAGGHLNPAKLKHGRKNPQGAHLGDLPNLDVAKDGKAEKTVEIIGAEARLGFKTFLGTSGLALVIHADRDDETTDPTGNSGARIACAALAP